MPTNEDLEPSKKAGYDLRDVPASPVAIAIAALIGLMFAGFVGGYAFREVFEATEVKSRPESSPLVQREKVSGPLLQPHPEVELADYLRRQRAKLATYGWVDQQQKLVRIPIEEAMRIVATEGLPKWKAEVAKLPAKPEPIVEPEASPGNDPVVTQTESTSEGAD